MNLNLGVNILPKVRTVLVATALAGGALTTASVFKTPGTTINPCHKELRGIERLCGEIDPAEKLEYPEYDNSRSIASNVGEYALVTNNKLFDNVIDPITDKPVLPLTATALAMLGIKAIPNGKEENV